MKNPDFSKTALDYRKYRQGFPQDFFDRLNKKNIGISGQKVLDLGTGTGTVARGFKKLGCEVTAVDPSEELIAQAKIIDEEVVVNIKYVIGTAEATKQEEQIFDIVTAGQCWHWFKHYEAIKEVLRVIKPTGKLVIAHFDRLPIKNSISALSEQIMIKYNPNWTLGGGNGFYPQWATQLLEANFTNIETYNFDVFVTYSPQESPHFQERPFLAPIELNLQEKMLTYRCMLRFFLTNLIQYALKTDLLPRFKI